MGVLRLMCGIAGLLSLDGRTPPDPAALAAMSEALAHRGPDGAGIVHDGPAALAARRLAIVDLDGGAQPLTNESGGVHVVCNGEIYDHARWRDELRRRGHRLRTRSDCEVLSHLYEERGPGFVADLRGMFAVAVWDAGEQRLLLARDRFGIKPLFYAERGGRLAFASTLHALMTVPEVRCEVDLDALATYLTVNAVMGERTMLCGLNRLRPGHLLIADSAGVRIRRYARDLPAARGEERRGGPRTLAGEVRDTLRESVEAHLLGDVEAGVLLSGGVDSGLIAALAAPTAGHRLKTFAVGVTENAFDELDAARATARHLGTDHHEIVVGPEAAHELEAVARSFDEPRGDATALPYWLGARFAAEKVKVVLSGEGGDELFGGYQTYQADVMGRPAAQAAALMLPLLAAWPSSSGRLPLDFRLRRLARGAGLRALERHHAWKEIFDAEDRRRLVVPGRTGAADPLAEHRARFAETLHAEAISRIQDVDVGTFLADDLLVQTDRAGMAHGLEIRVPFLDRDLAALARALPRRAKVTVRCTKRVLREAASPLLPAMVVRAPKRGFCAPTAAWLRGPLLPFASDVLAGETLRRHGFFQPDAVHSILHRHVARREDLSRPLWALIAFTLWHDAHLSPRGPGRGPGEPLPPVADVASAIA
jgi:asparagine synthase (glutamine-hydrolysing)